MEHRKQPQHQKEVNSRRTDRQTDVKETLGERERHPQERSVGGSSNKPRQKSEWTELYYIQFSTPFTPIIRIKADESFIYKRGSPAWNQPTNDGRREGQDSKTGLKMEEKSKKLQALWTHNNNIALHPNCHCTCSLPTALKTFLSSLFLALFHLARSRWTLDLRI